MTNIKRRLTAGLLILLLLIKFTYPIAVLADTSVSDTPTPTPTIEVTPTPDLSTTIDASSGANITNNNNSTADSGNNTVSTNCETPADTATAEGTLSSTTTQDPCPTPTPDPNASAINTGDSTSVTTVQNNVDVSAVNSSLINDSQTVSGTQNSNVNLGNNNISLDATSSAAPVGGAVPGSNNIDSSATLDNTVISVANSGSNSASGSAVIDSGNAYSVVAVVNNVSLTLVNSALQILSLNIFGTLNGNVTLPDSNNSSCTLCNSNTTQEINNNATVTNNVDSQAISGQNSISDAASATISSGQSISIVNLLNLINSLFIGSNVKGIFVNVFGEWNGQFVGWGDLSSADGGSNLILLNSGLGDAQANCNCATSSNINNNTVVNNNVTSIANSGQNNISGGSGDQIKTGNAYSQVSIINLVNTTFINSTGIFAFINIFGTLNGDIGGYSNFQQKDNPTTTPETTTANEISNKDQGGGLLSISQSNNVGKYVLPGDTVTFSIKVKNPGSGIVRNAKVNLNLIRDGIVIGKVSYNLGDISAGRGKTLTTGIVLSKNAHSGLYGADTIAEGVSGDTTVSDESSSEFSVFSPVFAYSNTDTKTNDSKAKVLSAATSIKDDTNYPTGASYDIKTLLMLALLYLGVRILRNYKEIKRISESKSILNFVQIAQKMLM